MIPRATIRLQFNRHFTFDHAVAVVPYFSSLHLTHIYASPIFAARSGSTHGYDVVDPNTINPELGGLEGLQRLAAALAARNMGLIIDIVPNHMAAAHENPWWFEVLEHGRHSPFAKFFDINWRPADPQLHNRVLLPILGNSLTACLAAGEITLAYDEDRRRFVLHYYDHLLPLSPGSYRSVLRQLGEPFAEVAQQWPISREMTPAIFDERRAALAELRAANRSHFDHSLQNLGADTLRSSELLTKILSRQHYTLAPWTDAGQRINWRRFFDISGLVALRMDRSEVFAATHALTLQLYGDGLIDGVRLDHVDGLADPEAYCRRLRRALQRAGSKRPEGKRAPYILVEKILEADETVPTTWKVDGNTGYDFMAEVSALLHDPAGEPVLTKLWTDASGDARDFATVATAARHEILQRLFPRYLQDVADLFIAATRTRPTSAAQEAVRRGLTQLLSVFTRYRIYGSAQGLSGDDDNVLAAYRRRASIDLPDSDRQALDMICQQLRERDSNDARGAEARTRFQQLSATLAAKAVEDTAFYRYGRLLSRNDVGSDPGQFHLPLERFHAAGQRRQKLYPHSLLATATHDHKRGEDMRCRLAVLSEDAAHWSDLTRRWLVRHHDLHPTVPEAVKLMTYQTIIGAWPLLPHATHAVEIEDFSERLLVWLQKALREAKQETSWDRPNADYEAACNAFLQSLLDLARPDYFLADAARYADRIAPAGALNGLTQLTLRLTSPGVPDLYQGCEFWDLSLVDPDNRRPVDFARRQEALSDDREFAGLLQDWRDGKVKQRLMQCLLATRAMMPDLFSVGRYLPLALSGPAADRLIAFARQHEDESLVVVVPRLVFDMLQDAPAPHIPAQRWRNTLIHLPKMIDGEVFTDCLTGRHHDFQGSILPTEQLLEPFSLCVLHQRRSRAGKASDGA
ncbi:MAG TPA: malto-oligosyltrehalose synthase [Dongiaceae bacterium]|nr:malto-oligosyltrehalose synthase [Dongiaceae bacterium]